MRIFEAILALRYVKPRFSFISILTFFSLLGPVIGVAVLIVVIAVMSGFDRDIKKSILNMQSHFSIQRYGSHITNPQQLIDKIEANTKMRASATVEGGVLLQSANSEVDTKMLVGIMPEAEKGVTHLYDKIRDGGKYDLADNEVLIGDILARRKHLRVGSKIVLHSLNSLGNNLKFDDSGIKMSENPELSIPIELTVVGIFSLNMFEYDSGIIFSNLDTADEILGYDWGTASKIKIATEDPFFLTDNQKELKKLFPYSYAIRTWIDENQLLFGTLQMEKNMMFFILFFIVLVASFGIGGTLLTFAMKKNREIAVLKSLGATPGQVMRVFLLLGLLIGTISTSLGTVLGIVIVHYRQHVADFLSYLKGSNVFPPELYHLTKIPGMLNTSDLLIIFFGSLLLCVVAAMLPALFAAWTNPARALKSEEVL